MTTKVGCCEAVCWLDKTFWHNLCLQYSQSKFSSVNAFLCSEESGPDVLVEDSWTFTRQLWKFKEGHLSNGDQKRNNLSSVTLWRCQGFSSRVHRAPCASLHLRQLQTSGYRGVKQMKSKECISLGGYLWSWCLDSTLHGWKVQTTRVLQAVCWKHSSHGVSTSSQCLVW